MVTARFLPHLGGTEIHTYELARRLVPRGIDVAVLTTELDATCVGSHSSYGFPVIRVRAWPRQRDWYVAPGIRKVIRNGHWDLVHVQGIHTMVLPIALAAARGARSPYVITLHTGGHSSVIRRLARHLVWRSVRGWIRNADWIIAVSEFERKRLGSLLAIPARKLTVIPSGVELRDPGLEPELGRERGAQHAKTPLIVSVGRLDRHKGHDRLLRALPAVASRFPSVRLVILGGGRDEQRLRGIAVKAGLGDRVEIRSIPADRREELHALLERANLVVALSTYESQGLAAMEAVGLGCSVLVADASALSELVAAGLARGVRPGSSCEELADAIVAQLRRPHRPSGALPTWDACAAKTEGLYRSLVRSDRPAASPRS